MEADALDGSRFKLVYLDSSQLGISESFIASARRNGVRHFLAPSSATRPAIRPRS